jgi:hypothetical protein
LSRGKEKSTSTRKNRHQFTVHAKNMAGDLIPLVADKWTSWRGLHSQLAKIVKPFKPWFLKIFLLDDEKSIDDDEFNEQFMDSDMNLKDDDMFGFLLIEPKIEIVSSCCVNYASDEREKPLYFAAVGVSTEDEILWEMEFVYRIKDNKFFGPNSIIEDSPEYDHHDDSYITPWYLSGIGHNSFQEMIEAFSESIGDDMTQFVLTNQKRIMCDFLEKISKKRRPGFPDEKQLALEQLAMFE